jgi:chromosomal replication initiation ATPase DnaA
MNTPQPAMVSASRWQVSPQGRRLRGSIHQIMTEVVIAHFAKELLTGNRNPQIVRARHELFYRCVTETNKSLRTIGRLTNHHHSTVLAGARTHATRNGLNGG